MANDARSPHVTNNTGTPPLRGASHVARSHRLGLARSLAWGGRSLTQVSPPAAPLPETGALRGRRLLTVAEYAAATGIPEQTVRDQLRGGRLRGRDLNRRTGKRARWRIPAGEARRALQRQPDQRRET